ncbi:MAG: hypothetical protein JWN46_2111 [Acidimicrobiales bacterium]|nr:hypothetical protein [Acidimicrobiales bacterium]
MSNPFEGMPFFGDLLKMLGQQGPVSWDGARQLALSIATEGESEPNVDPLERIRFEQLARVADLQVANASGLPTSVAGRPVAITPVTRTQWVLRTVDDYRPLFERLAGALGHRDEPTAGPTISSQHPAAGGQAIEPGDDDHPEDAWMAQLMAVLSPMMLGMTAGSLVGHLATRSFGQYDLPIPRPPSDELPVLVSNIEPFAREWSLDGDDLRLWVCVQEVAHHAVLGVPHVRARLEELLAGYSEAFQSDPNALEHKLGELDPSSMESMQGMQDLFGDPEVLLGAIQSDRQRELLPRLDALVTVIGGYVDHLMDRIGGTLIGSYGMVTEAMRRRRVEASSSDRFVERLFGLELTQERFDRGAAFVDGVVERAGDEGLARLWKSERELPTPAEVDAPGLWLARIDLAD